MRYSGRSITMVVVSMWLLACAAAAAEPVQPRFAVGWAVPQGATRYDGGFTAGAGLAFQASPRVGVVADVSGTWISAPPAGMTVRPYLAGSYTGIPARSDVTLLAVTLGARVRPFGARTRPYAEAALGGQWAREHSGFSDAWYLPTRIGDTGIIGRVRLGTNLLPVGRGGVFADVGYEFPLRNPDRYWVVPMRVGVELP